jgi:hypothetical protein
VAPPVLKTRGRMQHSEPISSWFLRSRSLDLVRSANPNRTGRLAVSHSIRQSATRTGTCFRSSELTASPANLGGKSGTTMRMIRRPPSYDREIGSDRIGPAPFRCSRSRSLRLLIRMAHRSGPTTLTEPRWKTATNKTQPKFFCFPHVESLTVDTACAYPCWSGTT